MKNYLLISYFFLFVIFTLFSFVLTDPNLILLKADFFLVFQNFLWQNVLPLQNFRTIFFSILIILIFGNYLLIIRNWAKFGLENRQKFWQFLLLISLPLVFSYNALSHDLFNYIFNAKMLVTYGANPHLKTALDFANDPMLRFMNNVHTPAPYGYAWTAISILPYLAGLGKFLSTFLMFKLFALFSLFLSLLIAEKISKNNNYAKLALFFLNPLLLIEVLSSAHNDLWMLSPALLAFYLASNLENKKAWKIFFILLLLSFSIAIKYATIALIPLILYQVFYKKLSKLKITPYLYDLAALAMFAPLLTERSRFFLPWYLLWALIFLPFLRSLFLRNLLLVFSLSSLLRYTPWLYYLPWMSFHLDNSKLFPLQVLVTWTIPGFYLLLSGLLFLFNRRREK